MPPTRWFVQEVGLNDPMRFEVTFGPVLKNYHSCHAVHNQERDGSVVRANLLTGGSLWVVALSCQIGARWPKWLEREFTDRKVRGSKPTSASRLPGLGLGSMAVSQPSCFIRVAWQLDTVRVLQLNLLLPVKQLEYSK
ncbi:hypothetical protein T265_14729, partial [Opisthorchis viverrini]